MTARTSLTNLPFGHSWEGTARFYSIGMVQKPGPGITQTPAHSRVWWPMLAVSGSPALARDSSGRLGFLATWWLRSKAKLLASRGARWEPFCCRWHGLGRSAVLLSLLLFWSRERARLGGEALDLEEQVGSQRWLRPFLENTVCHSLGGICRSVTFSKCEALRRERQTLCASYQKPVPGNSGVVTWGRLSLW